MPVKNTKLDLDNNVSRGIPILWGTATPSAQKVNVLSIPATFPNDSQVTDWWIYRNRTGYLDTTLPDATQPDAFYYVGEVALGTTSFQDNVEDSTLPSRERIDFERRYVKSSSLARDIPPQVLDLTAISTSGSGKQTATFFMPFFRGIGDHILPGAHHS